MQGPILPVTAATFAAARPAFQPTPNGYITLTLQGHPVTLVGGPWAAFKGQGLAICLNKSSPGSGLADLLLDIEDYQPPTQHQLTTAVATVTYWAKHHPGLPVFVGCLGGIGRTGTILAALAKAAGVENPVTWIRWAYFSRAVETTLQENAVTVFDPTLAFEVLGHGFKALTFEDRQRLADGTYEDEPVKKLPWYAKLWGKLR